MPDPVLEHFHDRRNAGPLPGAHGSGQAGDLSCGAVIKMHVIFAGGTVSRSGFEASGSSAAIAAASVLAGLITDKPWRQAAAVSAQSIEAELGITLGGAGGKGSASDLRRAASINTAAAFAIEALHLAFENAIQRGCFPRASAVNSNSVAVAMSGGVDSSAACLLQKESGREVVGLTVRLWSDPACDTGVSGCCSPQAIRDARQVCHQLGLPHLTVDLRDRFKSTVVDNFIAEYLNGRTPNPCCRCNGVFRFSALAELADMLGAGRIATGHYARRETVNGENRLCRGTDRKKDQSYMLWGVEPDLLGRLHFPLAGLTKPQTRRLAARALLSTHSRPESQEICFIPDDDYRRFLKIHAGNLPGLGEIIDVKGNRIGVHTGYVNYTVGQRRGLGLSAPEPHYVLVTIPEKNKVIVGPRGLLAADRFEVTGLNVFCPRALGGRLDVQIRYNSPAIRCSISKKTPEIWIIKLEKQAYGIAPGQSAVFYAGDTVVAGGIISHAGKNLFSS